MAENVTTVPVNQISPNTNGKLRITHSVCVGGPMEIHTIDGVMRRVRPIVLTDDDAPGWVIKARGQEFTPQRKTTMSLLGYCEKDRTYAYDRLKYPMIREDFVETPDGKNRNTENRGKSGYRRASWDEALSLVAREIKRLHKTYGKETITACTSSHHSWGLSGYKISLFKRFFSMMGYTRIADNPDSWEGFTWGTPHTYGYYWRLGGPEPFDMLEMALQNTETIIMWSHDPDTTRGGYSAQESALWRWWMKDLGIKFIFIDPMNNFSSVKMADKWYGLRMGTDAAFLEAIAYTWVTEGIYDKEYVAQHGHRFKEWEAHLLGLGPDGTAKTPKWAEGICGIKAADIKALARLWASDVTIAGSGMRGGFGGACRTVGGTDYARLIVSLLGMQGMGKPGRNMWGGSCGAPMNYNFWFGGYSDPLSSISGYPVCDNPAINTVEQVLYRPNLPDAILDGHYEWYGEGFCGGGLDFEFTRHVYPLPGYNKVHCFWRYGGSFIGTMLDTNKWVRMYKSPELEFVINQDIYFTPETRHADVILPACTNLERVDIGEVGNSGNGGYCSHSQTGNSWQVIVFQDKAIEPLWDSRSDFWIFSQVAARLGWGEEFTEGRNEEQWAKRFWQFSDLPKHMSWEEFKKKGYYIPPVSYKPEDRDPKTGLIENWDRWPGFQWFAENRPCDTPNHQIFQEEHKLGTLTGKWEFVSESMLYWAPDDEIRTPVAHYKDAWEGHKSLSADKYPYGMISPHPRFDYHTHYNLHAVWLWEIPENRHYINGNPYLVCRINPKVAAQKGIKDGDIVRLFNDRGSVLCAARVTRRVNKETIHAYTSSGIYNPIEYGERESWDKGGSVNLLVPGRLMGEYVPAMVPNSCNIDVELAEADPNFGQGFEHILDAVDKQQLETQRPIRTSAEADLLFGEKEAKIS
ncbi:MAG: molybdopterin-dependent oxidoreductase [Oscillospiraceae bacterium]|nr:molybdopterin-dependent oxidoreductase [Oscillospiraceae bacterium]